MENLLRGYRVEPDEGEVFRLMGYPDGARVSDPVLEVCREQISRVGEVADPWGGHVELRITGGDGDEVRIESGHVLNSNRVAGILRRSDSLAVYVVTLGSPATEEIHRLQTENFMPEVLAFDAAATVATGALLGKLRERICTEAAAHGCGTTIAYGPGYSGWEIHDMTKLFSCLRGEEVPVRLNDQLMMIPEKSLLGVVGIVPGGRRELIDVEPCRLCDLARCSVRREPYRSPEAGHEGA